MAAPLSRGAGASAGVGGDVGENRSGSPSVEDLNGPAGENFNGLRRKEKKRKEGDVGREGRKEEPLSRSCEHSPSGQCQTLWSRQRFKDVLSSCVFIC